MAAARCARRWRTGLGARRAPARRSLAPRGRSRCSAASPSAPAPLVGAGAGRPVAPRRLLGLLASRRGGAACVAVGLRRRPAAAASRRRSSTAQLVIAAGRGRRSGCGCRVTGVVWARHAALAAVAGRALERLQPARQHGRPGRRRRGASPALALALLFAGIGRRSTAALLAAAVGGACAGFLLHNFHPASIFMGDAGSLFLGFIVGGLSARRQRRHARPARRRRCSCPVLIVLVPIFDTAFVDRAPLRRRPADLAGRPRPHVAPARRRRLQRAAGGVGALRASARCRRVVALATARYGLADTGVAIVLLGDRPGAVRRLPRPGRRLCRAGRRRRRAAPRCRPRRPTGGRPAAFAVDVLLVALAYYAAYRLRFEQTYAAERAAVRRVAAARRRRQDGGLRGAAHLPGPVAAHRASPTSCGSPRRSCSAACSSVLGVLAAVPLPRLLARAVRRRRRAAVPVPRRQPRRRPPDGGRAAAAADRPHADRDLRRRRGRPDGAARDPHRTARSAARRSPSSTTIRRWPAPTSTACASPAAAIASRRCCGSTPVAEVVVSSTKIAPERLAQVRDVCDAHGVTVVRSVLRFE